MINDFANMKRRGRAWKNMAQSALMRRVDPSWVPMPHAGHFILTFKCNLIGPFLYYVFPVTKFFT